jgi:4-hydroxybenzoate polyprenyltransferase
METLRRSPLPAGDFSGRYAWWVIQVLALSGPVVCEWRDPWVQ